MHCNMLAVILIPALTAAQTQPPTQLDGDRAAVSTSAGSSAYRFHTRYDHLRRGTSEEVVLELTHADFVTTSKAATPAIEPLRLELQPAEALTFTKIRYPKTRPTKFSFGAEPMPVSVFPVIRFKIHADQDAAVGVHTLRGKLAFQPIGIRSGAGAPEFVDVELPITVVAQDAEVRRSSLPYDGTPAAERVWLIILWPVMMPLWLIACTLGGQDCSC